MLREFGCGIPLGAHHVLARASVLLADPDSDLPEALRPALTARSVLWAANKRRTPDRLRAWALHLQSLRGHNKAAVALANKLARIVWAVWKHNVDFREVAA